MGYPDWPTTMYKAMFHAMAEKDYDAVSLYGTDLLVWINNVGVPPKGLSLEETRIICETTLLILKERTL